MTTQKFIKIVAQPQIAASTKLEMDLDNVRATYGDNFNTLIITNTDTASDINVYLDGEQIAYVTQDNGIFSFDWELGLNYNFLSIENTNAGAAIAAQGIKIFVGRTGAD